MAQWKVIYKARLEGHAHAACFVEAETEDQARSAMVQFGVTPDRLVSIALWPVDPCAQYEPRPVAIKPSPATVKSCPGCGEEMGGYERSRGWCDECDREKSEAEEDARRA